MAKRYINKRTGKYVPSIAIERRSHAEMVMRDTERELKRKNPTEKKYGARSRFLEKYKVEGYEKAKKAINEGFEKEIYGDVILKKWIEEERG